MLFEKSSKVTGLHQNRASDSKLNMSSVASIGESSTGKCRACTCKFERSELSESSQRTNIYWWSRADAMVGSLSFSSTVYPDRLDSMRWTRAYLPRIDIGWMTQVVLHGRTALLLPSALPKCHRSFPSRRRNCTSIPWSVSVHAAHTIFPGPETLCPRSPNLPHLRRLYLRNFFGVPYLWSFIRNLPLPDFLEIPRSL